MLGIDTETIRFGQFQIDLPAGRLMSGTTIIDLRPKAFAVLRHLVERPGQLVTKEQLLAAVWPGVNVEEAVLKGTIGEIRNALADSSREPRFIETAHRRGYRFIAPVATYLSKSPVKTSGSVRRRFHLADASPEMLNKIVAALSDLVIPDSIRKYFKPRGMGKYRPGTRRKPRGRRDRSLELVFWAPEQIIESLHIPDSKPYLKLTVS